MIDLIAISQYQDIVGGLTYEQCADEDPFYRNFKITMVGLRHEKDEMENSKSSNIKKNK